MKKLALICLLVACASAQTLVITGPSQARAGDTVALDLRITSNGVSTIQWALPAGATVSSTVTQPSFASHSVICWVDASQITKCVMFGGKPAPPITSSTVFTKNVIPDGVIQQISYKVPDNQVPGPIMLNTSLQTGAKPDGTQVPVQVVPYAVDISPDPLDINRDGKIDWSDVDAAVTALKTDFSPANLGLLNMVVMKVAPPQ